MNILDTIKTRRTIKPELFNGKKIEVSLINTMLEAANWAPTHGFTEPWRFIVFEDAHKFGKLHADLYRQETPTEEFLQKKYDTILHKPDLASHIVVIVMKRGTNQNIPEIEEIAAAACAVQNMLLVATENKIAVYWGSGGMCYHPKMKEHFGFAEEDKILGFLYLGYTDNEIPKGLRNTSIEKKVRWF